MFSIRSTITAGAAMLVAATTVATAADLNGYNGSMKDGSAYMPAIQATPSWYLRVDGAYGSFDDPVMTENKYWDLTNTSIDNTWSIGGGFGRYIGRNARIEFTYDHRFEANAQGTLSDPASPLPGVRRFGIKSDLLLTSLYYDFDSMRGFRPYIGVGLGAVRHTTTPGNIESCGCTVATIEKGDNWNVAGALMAGFSYQLRDRLHFDAGYRFLYLGEAKTGAITTIAPGPVAVAQDPDVKEMHAHEFRFGLRYDIW